MAAYVRKNVRNSILYAYVENFFDAIGFFLLYDCSYFRELKPYWKFHSFKKDNFDEAQYLIEFPITNNDIYRLADVLQTPENNMLSDNSRSQYQVHFLYL